jgi:60 kDa SS-A/Ro ribonucleoprotein
MKYATILSQLLGRGASAPKPGMIANDAGGFVYPVDDWMRLDRFLVLGTEAGTYYADPIALTAENASAVGRALATDGARAVARIVAVSEDGRAPSQDPALLALAMAASSDSADTRRAALVALPRVARTAAHLLRFAGYANALRGWGRGLRRAIAGWFLARPADALAFQAVKYGQREGWALRDLLRLAHPLSDNAERRALFDWIAHPDKPEAVAAARASFALIDAVHRLRETGDVASAAELVAARRVPREAVPTPLLREGAVWQALLADMPLTALIRSLGRLSALGVLDPAAPATAAVAERLVDRARLQAARIHPIKLLIAMKTYAQGRGELGRLAWTPAPAVLDALDVAFDRAFDAVVRTGQRILIAVDVSASMRGVPVAGTPTLLVQEAAAAMALTLVRSETLAHVLSFDTAARPVALSARQRLDDAMRAFGTDGAGTDIAQPVLYALERRIAVDAFVILTDGETWAGRTHAVDALATYRRQVNRGAKLVVAAMAANRGLVVPADDALALGIAGFDAAVPELVSAFLRGA